MKIAKKPWGYENHFVFNKPCTVKIHCVKPSGALSLQKHKKRIEEWYFLTDGWVQLGNKKEKIKKGTFLKIRKGQVHRIFSKGKLVQVLEICYGRFDDKDIIRLEDKYGRD